MDIAANRFTFAKVGPNRFQVEGVFPINRGRHAPEAFSQVVAGKAKAEAMAARYSACALDSVLDFLADRATRLDLAKAYLASRAARPVDCQLSFL